MLPGNQAAAAVWILCRVMDVSPSGCYAWRKRLSKPPCLKRKKLADLVRNCYFASWRRYGARRIKKSLARDGFKVGRARLRRLMKEQNFKAIQPKSFKPRITDSKGVKAATNLLAEIHIEECAVGKIIIGSITYLPLRGGAFCYLAVWQDKVTRRVISWSLAATLEAELVISALEKAIRKGLIKAAPIIHSDQVSQCASTAFQGLLRICCFRQSMSGRGNCYDNAQAETFFLPI